MLGLPIFTDAANDQFVWYQNQWVHLSQMNLPQLHTVEMATTNPKPRRVPQFISTPVVPNIPAFKETTAEQRAPASKQFVPPNQ